MTYHKRIDLFQVKTDAPCDRFPALEDNAVNRENHPSVVPARQAGTTEREQTKRCIRFHRVNNKRKQIVTCGAVHSQVKTGLPYRMFHVLENQWSTGESILRQFPLGKRELPSGNYWEFSVARLERKKLYAWDFFIAALATATHWRISSTGLSGFSSYSSEKAPFSGKFTSSRAMTTASTFR